MRPKFFIAAAMAFIAMPALAENKIEIDSGVCDTLINHVPVPDATYQPGIDADGNPVAPADIAAQIAVPTKIVVPITDYLATRLTGTQQTGTLSPQVIVGTVALENGQISFNGQPIGGDVDGELGQLCRKARQ